MAKTDNNKSENDISKLFFYNFAILSNFIDEFEDLGEANPELERQINNTNAIISNLEFTTDDTGKSEYGSNFDEAVVIILESEGYISDHKYDRGGHTIFGISEGANPEAVALMREMDPETAKQYAIGIYKKNYWDAVDGIEDMDRNTALVAFDASVNHGQGYANRLVSETGGDISAMLEKRYDKYIAIAERDPNQGVFLQGWKNRLENLKDKLHDGQDLAQTKHLESTLENEHEISSPKLEITSTN